MVLRISGWIRVLQGMWFRQTPVNPFFYYFPGGILLTSVGALVNVAIRFPIILLFIIRYFN